MAVSSYALLSAIWQDTRRYALSYFLLVLVVISAFAVIYFTHINRQTTNQLEVLFSERDELDIEWRNLLIEQNSLAEHSSIESKATKFLNMTRPNADSEVVITLQ
jgi:cell division protein FtsL